MPEFHALAAVERCKVEGFECEQALVQYIVSAIPRTEPDPRRACAGGLRGYGAIDDRRLSGPVWIQSVSRCPPAA